MLSSNKIYILDQNLPIKKKKKKKNPSMHWFDHKE